MNKKRGFTIAELIGVIVILGIILTIIVLPIVKSVQNSKDKVHEAQERSILLALQSWATDNKATLPERDGDGITLTIGDLQNLGYLEMNLNDSLTGECLSADMELTITKEGNSYVYAINRDSGSDDCSGGSKPKGPIIILNGKTLEYVELGGKYTDPGATAKTYKGEDITIDMDVVITGDGDYIDTSNFYRYVIIYTVTDNEITTTVKRTVVIEDKTPPVLTIPGDVSIRASETTFDLMEGVSATDNSGEVTITIEGNLSLGNYGTYQITYVAKDKSGNTTKKTRIIKVLDDLPPTSSVTIQGTPFNSNNWSKTNIVAIVNIHDTGGSGAQGFKYCLTTSTTCIPNTDVKKIYELITISTESATNRICIVAYDYDNNQSASTCFGPYKIDKTNPTCSVGHTGTVGSNSWYTSNVSLTLTRDDSLSGVETYGLTTSATATYNSSATATHSTDTASITYYGYARDLAGNTISCNNNFKRDATAPTASLAVSGSPFNASNWAKANFSVNATATASVSGINNITYCTATSNNCTPGTNITGATGSITVSAESATNYVCAYTTNNAGQKSSTVCSGPHKLDKTVPTCSLSQSGTYGSNSWYSTNVTGNLTYSDSLSGISGYGVSTSSSATYNSTSSYSHSSDTTGVTYYGFVQDAAGNTNSCSTTFKRDTTNPTCSLSLSGTMGNNNWYRSNVTVTLNRSDATSGISSYGLTTSSSATYNSTASTTHSSDTSSVTYYGFVQDAAGRTSNCSTSFKRDATNPNISHSGNVSLQQGGWADIWSGVSYSDGTSGVVSVGNNGSPNFSAAGTYTISYTATDAAGNSATTGGRTYTVTNPPPPASGSYSCSGQGGQSSGYPNAAVFNWTMSGNTMNWNINAAGASTSGRYILIQGANTNVFLNVWICGTHVFSQARSALTSGQLFNGQRGSGSIYATAGCALTIETRYWYASAQYNSCTWYF